MAPDSRSREDYCNAQNLLVGLAMQVEQELIKLIWQTALLPAYKYLAACMVIQLHKPLSQFWAAEQRFHLSCDMAKVMLTPLYISDFGAASRGNSLKAKRGGGGFSWLCKGSWADGGKDKLPHLASIVSLFCRLSIWLALFQRYFVPFEAHEKSAACFRPALPPRRCSPDHSECKWDADLQIASLARDPSCIWIKLSPQVGKSSVHREYLRSWRLMENFEKQSTFRISSACTSNILGIALHFFVIAKDICMKIGSSFFKHSSVPAACCSLGDLTPVESQARAVWEMSGSLRKKEKVRDGKGRPGET